MENTAQSTLFLSHLTVYHVRVSVHAVKHIRVAGINPIAWQIFFQMTKALAMNYRVDTSKISSKLFGQIYFLIFSVNILHFNAILKK